MYVYTALYESIYICKFVCIAGILVNLLVCAVCRAAAPKGGDHEDAGPDSAAGALAQHQVRATLTE